MVMMVIIYLVYDTMFSGYGKTQTIVSVCVYVCVCVCVWGCIQRCVFKCVWELFLRPDILCCGVHGDMFSLCLSLSYFFSVSVRVLCVCVVCVSECPI